MRYWLLIIITLSSFLSAQDSLTVIGEIALPSEYGNAINFPSGFLNYKSGGDLNQNGYSDLICAFYNSELENYCLGAYWGGTTPWLYPDEIAPNPNSFFTTLLPSWQGDLNGDSANDLVITYWNYVDICYVGFIMGDGEFTTVPDSTFSFWYWGGFLAWNGGYDFNADGYDDILCLDYTSEFWNGNVDILYGGDPMDTITDIHFEGDYDDFFMLGDVASVGDVNGDGSPDLLLSHVNYEDFEEPASLSVYCGGEDFDTSPETTIQMPDNFFAMNALGLMASNGDFNGDGYDDLIEPGMDALYIHWGSEYLSNFITPDTLNIELEQPNSLYIEGHYCNINNDEYDDIVVKAMYEGKVYVYCGGESLPENYSFMLSGTEVTYYSRSIDLGDFNGDGYSDILYALDDTVPYRAAIVSLAPVSIDDEEIEQPELITLSNFPNPFNPSTTIRFDLPKDSDVTLSIYNIKGQKVKSLVNEKLEMGRYNIRWDGDDATGKQMSSGVYLYRLEAGGHTKVKKMLLLK